MRSLKTKNRNVKKFSDYYRHEGIKAVFYICRTKEIYRSLMNVDKEVKSDKASKIYFCLEKDVRNNPEKITFKNYNSDFVIFK